MAGNGSWRPQYDSRRQKGARGSYSPSKMSFSEHRDKGPSTFFAGQWVLLGTVGALAMALLSLVALLRGDVADFVFAIVCATVCYKLFFHRRS